MCAEYGKMGRKSDDLMVKQITVHLSCSGNGCYITMYSANLRPVNITCKHCFTALQRSNLNLSNRLLSQNTIHVEMANFALGWNPESK